MGYEIQTHQMQYEAADKETDQKSMMSTLYIEGTVLQNVDKLKIPL